MPELPEVETTRRGITEFILHQKIKKIVVRQPKLRWPVPVSVLQRVIGKNILSIDRRAKYILLEVGSATTNTTAITLIIHLGMSGHLKILQHDTTPQKHDHLDILFENGVCLRYNDPRRFGTILCTDGDPTQHALLRHLGVEPFTKEFNAQYLLSQSRKRNVTMKQFIMNHHVVVGVGNIYANEALFNASISPYLKASQLTLAQCKKIVSAVNTILTKAINAGGTTLKDFLSSEGKPGYFTQQLLVYGREKSPCPRCGEKIKKDIIGQRSTFYCPKCQRL
jgi:formamidopyrimidine-DNA glycosylase